MLSFILALSLLFVNSGTPQAPRSPIIERDCTNSAGSQTACHDRIEEDDEPDTDGGGR